MRYLYFTLFFVFLFQCSYSQGSVLLVGGGSENYSDWSDIPYGWLVNHAPNKKILILHYSTLSTFLPDYFKSLGASQAVSTAISSATANDSATYRMILEYDGIFLRGGDQWEYVKQWNGTLTEEAITKVFQRGGAIGGTSAGAMVLSKFIADAGTTSVDPRTSIRTPLTAGISFTNDFLGFIPGILCDTHFYERGRLARLLAMQAVHYKISGTWFTGVGIDDATALGVSSNGSAEVFGSGVVSFVVPNKNTTAAVTAGKPLGLSDMTLRQYTKGAVIQLPAATNISAPTMSAYQALPFSSVQKNIVLDGSSVTADWSTVSGSLNAFINRAGNDTIEILTSAPANIQINDIRSFLSAHNVSTSVTVVSPAQRQSADFAKL
ncbi:MAG: cyanophycinase, partial [Bacteroidota bacterium]